MGTSGESVSASARVRDIRVAVMLAILLVSTSGQARPTTREIQVERLETVVEQMRVADARLAPEDRVTLRAQCCEWASQTLSDCTLQGALGALDVQRDRVCMEEQAVRICAMRRDVFQISVRVPTARVDPPRSSDGVHKPRGGYVGVTIAGPALLLGADAQYVAFDAVALEVGVFPGAPSVWGWVGTRARWPRGISRPFVGAWATAGIAGEGPCDEGAEEAEADDSMCPGTFALWAFRAGVDLELKGGRRLLSLELDLVRPAATNTFLSSDWPFLPWGGLTYSGAI